MKLPDNPSRITRMTYEGQKDDEGRPHGYGTMKYSTSGEKKYKYEGHFVHGVRSGYGVWHETIQIVREYEPWEWAQMGDYDSAGRLIHPNTRPGPRREVINYWDVKFRGWWKNDEAIHDMRGKRYSGGYPVSAAEDNLDTKQAIRACEQCIINGNYAPIYDLAVIYLMEGEEEYYSILMEAGRRLGVPACLSESQD